MILPLLIFTAFLAANPARASSEGEAAAPFTATLLNGEKFSLANAKQVTLLHFWATWCGPCKTEMPVLNAYYKRHQKEGLQLIAISVDRDADADKVRSTMKEFAFPGAFAKEASFKGYGRIWRLPLTFVVDRQGTLRKDGWASDKTLTDDDLEKTVTPLLK